MGAPKPPVSTSRGVAASADRVFAMVSDLTRMGEWSPENKGGEWIKGATGPAVGARFKGRNANGKRQWSTVVEVVEFEPGRRISFALMVGPTRWCDWVWEVEAVDAANCRVTHSWVDRRGAAGSWLGGVVSGVKDRASHNLRNMESTLEALANSVA